MFWLLRFRPVSETSDRSEAEGVSRRVSSREEDKIIRTTTVNHTTLQTHIMNLFHAEVSIRRDPQLLWLHINDHKHRVGRVPLEQLVYFQV
jgi:hypothetical protein